MYCLVQLAGTRAGLEAFEFKWIVINAPVNLIIIIIVIIIYVEC